MTVKETAPAYRTHRKIYTYQDYLDLPEDGKRYEVIDGELIMAPAPDTGHQDVSGDLFVDLKIFVKKNKRGKVYCAPTAVVLNEHNVVQPDLLFISNERKHIITEKNISGAPDLIIEIVSPSSGYYDLVEKKEIYGRFGVQEYWIVDPKKQWLEIYFNEDGKFKSIQRLEKTGIAKSLVLTGFQIELKKLFAIE
jgi:Uma2 family endonuclease